MEALSDVLSAGVVVILGNLARLVFIAYFMFTLSWSLALVTLAVMPLMVAITFWFRKHAREQYRETRAQVARLNSFLQEHVTGMKAQWQRERQLIERLRSNSPNNQL